MDLFYSAKSDFHCKKYDPLKNNRQIHYSQNGRFGIFKE